MKHRPATLKSTRAVAESVRGLHRIFQNIDLFSRKVLREYGVSGPQIWALRTIRDAECTTMSDLAARLHLHPSTVSGIMDRLEKRGLAVRFQASNDARVTELRLTPAGRKVVSHVPEPPRSKIARGVEALPLEELSCVRRAVRILSRIMNVPDPPGGEIGGGS